MSYVPSTIPSIMIDGQLFTNMSKAVRTINSATLQGHHLYATREDGNTRIYRARYVQGIFQVKALHSGLWILAKTISTKD